jgi:predicted DNA-binding transcriptional regulator AlpA
MATKTRSTSKVARQRDAEEIDTDAAAKAAGLSKSTLRRRVYDVDSDFPQPLRLIRHWRFIRGEISAWRAAQIAARGMRPRPT